MNLKDLAFIIFIIGLLIYFCGAAYASRGTMIAGITLKGVGFLLLALVWFHILS